MQLLPKILLMLLLGLPFVRVSALTPMESILLGDLSKDYEKDELQFAESIFKGIKVEGSTKDKSQLQSYRVQLQESLSLKNYCRYKKPKVRYQSSWKRDQVKRSYLATAQFVGIDLTIRAIASYARHFEFTSDDYSNLVQGLSANYCSKNLSIISLKELRRNMMLHFFKGDFKLPNIRGNNLFAKKLNEIASNEEIKSKEFFYTLELFKSFCSWGGETSNLRLLVPLVRHPFIASLVARHLSGKNISVNGNDQFYKVKNSKSIQVMCENQICRRKSASEFDEYFPRSIGTSTLKDDIHRLYCEDFQFAEYKFSDQVPKIKSMIDKSSFDKEYLMIGQFISLFSGVSDLLVRSDNFSKAGVFLKGSFERYWNKWAKDQLAKFNDDLYYESPLRIELVNREFYFTKFKKDFAVQFDVNLGEFDRISQMVGKLKGKFNVKLSSALIKYIYSKWNEDHPRLSKLREDIISRVSAVIFPSVMKFRDEANIPKWKGNMERIIAKEFIEQVMNSRVTSDLIKQKERVNLSVEFNYAPFALKYIHYLHKVKKEVTRHRQMVKAVDKKIEISQKL